MEDKVPGYPGLILSEELLTLNPTQKKILLLGSVDLSITALSLATASCLFRRQANRMGLLDDSRRSMRRAQYPPLAAAEQARNDSQWDSSAKPDPEIEFNQRIVWSANTRTTWGAIRGAFLQIVTHAGPKSVIDCGAPAIPREEALDFRSFRGRVCFWEIQHRFTIALRLIRRCSIKPVRSSR